MAPRRNRDPLQADGTSMQGSAPEQVGANSAASIDIGNLVQSFQSLAQALQTQAQQNHRPGMPIMEQFMRMRPPTFKGESQPQIAENWLDEMEKILEAINCPTIDKVRLATFLFQERAQVWWRSTLRTTFADYEDGITWEEFLKAFQGKYFPEHIQYRKEMEFLNLSQGAL